MTDEFQILFRLPGRDKDRHKQVQRQARTVVEHIPAPPSHPGDSLKVTLFANRVAQGGIEPAGVHNRRPVGVVLIAGLPGPHVQIAGTVAALAADGHALEDRRAVAINCVRDRLDRVGVAKQARRLGRPLEQPEVAAVSRRQVPALLLGVPGDRRLEQAAVTLAEVRERAGARADDVLHFGLGLDDGAAVVVGESLAVEHTAVPTLHEEPGAVRREWVAVVRPVALPGRHRIHRPQRPAHRVLAVAVGDLAVTLGTGGVADVLHVRPDVEVAGGEGEARVLSRPGVVGRWGLFGVGRPPGVPGGDRAGGARRCQEEGKQTPEGEPSGG